MKLQFKGQKATIIRPQIQACQIQIFNNLVIKKFLKISLKYRYICIDRYLFIILLTSTKYFK